MHRVMFRSQLFSIKLACVYCRCCCAEYGTQEACVGCMHFLCEELSLGRRLLLPAGPHCPSCLEGFLGCMHFFCEEASLCRRLLLPCRSTLSLLPRTSASFETCWTCTCHHTHSIRAPPHTALLLYKSYSCTQTYLHLTDAMLCKQTVSTHPGQVL